MRTSLLKLSQTQGSYKSSKFYYSALLINVHVFITPCNVFITPRNVFITHCTVFLSLVYCACAITLKPSLHTRSVLVLWRSTCPLYKLMYMSLLLPALSLLLPALSLLLPAMSLLLPLVYIYFNCQSIDPCSFTILFLGCEMRLCFLSVAIQ
jgi:hypothetical protein